MATKEFSPSRHIIRDDASILDALRALNSIEDGVMTLLAVSADNRLAGTITDGDIRRAMLRGASPADPLTAAVNTGCRTVSPEIPVEELKAARMLGIRLLPVVDGEGRLLKMLDLTRTETVLPLSAILMAGGNGERLRPLTLDRPKPLLEIEGMPIIDYNVRNLSRVGISDVTVTTRYLASQIHDHFSRPVFGIDVKCVEETSPLGTLGAVSLVERPDTGDTLVMNSDLLTTLSLEEMFILHKTEGADVTIAAVPYTVSVPYAILATDGRCVTALEEKPTYSHYANAGIYIFSNRLLNTVGKDTRTDAPDLIQKAIDDGLKVVYYPIDGLWIDIGSPADFRHAQELMRHHRALGRF